MCKFGNKIMFLTLWHFWWIFFDFPIFRIYRKWNFSFFPQNCFRNVFGLITYIMKLYLRLCNFKNVDLKFVSQYEKKSKWCKTSFEEYINGSTYVYIRSFNHTMLVLTQRLIWIKTLFLFTVILVIHHQMLKCLLKPWNLFKVEVAL